MRYLRIPTLIMGLMLLATTAWTSGTTQPAVGGILSLLYAIMVITSLTAAISRIRHHVYLATITLIVATLSTALMFIHAAS